MAFEDVMTSPEVARKLGISVSAVHRLCRRGTLPSGWLAGRRVWQRSQIEKYLADEEAQKRRPTGSTVRLGDQNLSLDEVTDILRRASNG